MEPGVFIGDWGKSLRLKTCSCFKLVGFASQAPFFNGVLCPPHTFLTKPSLTNSQVSYTNLILSLGDTVS